MFARHVLRSAQPLRTQCRRYATEPQLSSSSNKALYAGIATVLGGGSYYYLSQDTLGNGAKAKEAVEKGDEPVGKGGNGNVAFTGGDQGFIKLRLDNIEIVNHNTKKFRFALPEDDQVSGLHVASAILTKYKGPQMEKPVIRPYTPINDENAKGYLDLLVKKYPNGPMSTHLHDMAPGQMLEIKGPIPKYPWAENKHNHIALIAGGTGITPMYQLTRAIFNNPNDKTKVTLVFGNVTEEDILLKHELAELENTYPQRFRAFYVLDKAPNKDWRGDTGFITKELLKKVLPEPKNENIKVFVCGPPGMYKAISGMKKSPKDQGDLSGILKDLGYSQDQVYKF
ncbi:putative NADH-cytochrome b5 reductase 2 [Venustampulla echinocandica]|uniref:NADH-cytochrome b5 reductase n=1 Tax=Venustampulla echinocandica TaxID=2656787 RepID=A0A370U3X0_9HELO|nr:putative NADH-cytochrome b5 reductase 2 [Venustampulla echinocandica]RDL42469.1 putative NADH-cytochrome b5 reductase 2 [Venustampulla echinocandica]